MIQAFVQWRAGSDRADRSWRGGRHRWGPSRTVAVKPENSICVRADRLERDPIHGRLVIVDIKPARHRSARTYLNTLAISTGGGRKLGARGRAALCRKGPWRRRTQTGSAPARGNMAQPSSWRRGDSRSSCRSAQRRSACPRGRLSGPPRVGTMTNRAGTLQSQLSTGLSRYR